MTSLEKYSFYFGRSADMAVPPEPSLLNSPFVYRFPPLNISRFKRIFIQCELIDYVVYVTDGMSSRKMNVPSNERDIYPSQIELIACSTVAIIGGNDGRDLIAGSLQMLVDEMVKRDTFIGPAHTIDCAEPVFMNTEMTGFFFGVSLRMAFLIQHLLTAVMIWTKYHQSNQKR